MIRNVGEVLSERARLSGSMEGVIDLPTGRRLTYTQVNDRSNRIANALKGQGVLRGDRVAILMSNSLEYVESYYAIAKAGAITVFLNWRLSPRELLFILDDCGASIVLYSDDLSTLADALKPGASSVGQWISTAHTDPQSYAALLEASNEAPIITAQGDDGAYIMYTSGTTGRPKGALITHAGTIAWHQSMLATSDMRYGERCYTVAPLFHIGGVGTVMAAIYGGMTNVIDAVFDPDRVWRVLEEERISTTLLVPAMLNFMMKSPKAETAQCSHLRSILCGAAPVPVSLIEALAQKGIDVHQIYGATETHGGICLMMPEHALSKAGSTGKAYFGMEVRVVDSESRDVAPGVPGEVITRGAHVMKEYWRNPEETAKAFKDGWYYLGDVAEVDDEGFIYIKDRSKDMIISGGENIYPAEIENAILSVAGVKDVAVIGQPSQTWGESPAAIVVAKEHDGHEDLRSEIECVCQSELARYKHPCTIEFIDEIPRNPSGKALKRLLRERFPGPAPA